MRTFRNRTAVLATAAGAVLTLTLTACGGDGSVPKAAGSAPAGSTASVAGDPVPAASTSTAPPASGGGETTDGGSTSGGNTGTVRGTGAGKATGGRAATTRACTPQDVTLSAALEDGPPHTHLVLTARNTSRQTCRLNGFPEIQFLESHRQNVPAVAKSKPAAPVLLTAGAPAYARVKLSDGGVDEHNEPVTDFSVTLQGSDEVIAVRAPGAAGIAVDPAKWLTGYWTPQLRDGADEF
ncbi:DUF4232 domain-containing protein [Streptomyces sp. NPDC053755]|uniref:DUF4232 domain-containing protein n=1 Tax=Streptomyces sp. NPDC053755 TaxID=3155815 RepID=UPI003447BC83